MNENGALSDVRREESSHTKQGLEWVCAEQKEVEIWQLHDHTAQSRHI